ncbi:MAG TPA: aromatic ring-hydroxylating dioxygenase subunit alpha, partial [Burkholderiaceae bacterium]|nr:aromatic ring-hydroxylating dioxygenase subunit alpha [Burkholderiaceae bacterium]
IAAGFVGDTEGSPAAGRTADLSAAWPAQPSARLPRLIVDSPSEFLVHRDVYRDPEVFDWEMRFLFEGTWNLLGLESQIPQPHDFFTTHVGRCPVIVARGGDGVVRGFVNSCRHKGALVCHQSRGRTRTFVCQYHGWAYDSAGRNVRIRDREHGAYRPQFDAHDHDLQPLARFDSYRGLLFGSVCADVPPLPQYLGDMRAMIDLIVDQSPHGIECVPGIANFVYRGNWKLQLENGVDPYHFQATHRSYIDVLQRRARESGSTGTASVYSSFGDAALQRGTFCFAHGHNALWGPLPSQTARPLAASRDELERRVGPVRARWMLYARNLTLFPNAQFAENASLQLRIWRPLAPDRTELRTYCVAPVGESGDARALRIRQYEEFFNPGGLATPDDVANYEDCQAGLAAPNIDWQQGHARGAALAGTAGDAAAELGVRPTASVLGPFALGDETVMHGTYREWLRLIRAGLAREQHAGPAPAASACDAGAGRRPR